MNYFLVLIISVGVVLASLAVKNIFTRLRILIILAVFFNLKSEAFTCLELFKASTPANVVSLEQVPSKNPLFTDYLSRMQSIQRSHLLSVASNAVKQNLRQLFAKDNLLFSMSHSETLRLDILTQSKTQDFTFKNIYQTDSKKARTPIFVRLENEALRLGLSVTELQKQYTPSNLPKYGYLQFKNTPEGPHKGKLAIPQYGHDIYIFKTDKVIDSSTLTVGDSFMYKKTKFTLRKVFDEESKENNIFSDYDLRFVPFNLPEFVDWIVSNLLTTEVKRRLNKNDLTQVNSADLALAIEVAYQKWLKSKTLASPIFGFDLQKLENTGLGFLKKFLANYFEIQYFKDDLGINDIETFIFTEAPPSAEFYELLKLNKITVLDWRDQSRDPIEWRP